MSDLIITPSSGKIDFIYQSGQEISRLESITIDPTDGLVFSGKISASSVNSPLNVTATSSNINYPFIFASSGTTGAKSLLMDSAGGTYNPSTNLATIDISGTSSWASNAVTSLVCTGNAATATTASYANNLNAANSYTVAGITGNLTGTATTASYANNLNAANRYTVVGITGSLFGTSSWATNATNALQLGGTAAASYVTLTGAQNLSEKTITGTFTGALTGTATTASYANALNAANSYTIAGLTVNGNFAVNGSLTVFSASNVYITSSNLVVTDNIITMNALSPYQRYAGIQMYDTGSGTLSNFLWDGDGDYFFLSGSSVNGKIITGPDSQANLSANFVPKATAGYKLGNSVIYDDGTNIGIGLTTPDLRLHIEAANAYPATSGTTPTGFLTLRAKTAGGTHGMYMGVANASPYGSWIQCSDSTNLAANYPLLLNPNGGNVGIGTTNPSTKLHLYEAGAADVKLRLTAGNATYDPVFQMCGQDNDITSEGFEIWYDNDIGDVHLSTTYAADGASIHFHTRVGASKSTSNERLTILGNGNVGINTTSPAAKLQVSSTTAGATLLRTDGTNGTLFSVVDDLSDSLMSVNNSAGLPVLEVFADDRIVMGQYGQNDFVLVNNKVGIGTNNPVAELHVTASSNIPAAVFIGDVGIGTTAPTAQSNYRFLQVNGTNSAIIETMVGGARIGGFDSTSNTLYVGSIGSYPIVFRTAVDEKMRIAANGNVGIGTSSPAQKLEVQSGSVLIRGDGTALFGTYYASAGENTFFTMHSGSGNTFHIGNDVSGTNYTTMVFTAATDSTGGKVGIGTTNPVAKLQVAGNISGSSFTSSISNAVGFLGTSSWATNATNALQLGGTAAADYVTLTGTQTLTGKTITGTFTGNLTGTATTASYANALNAANSYTVVGITGNLTGNVTGTATTASYANALNAANSYTVTGITGALTGTSSWATNATNALQLGGTAAASYVTLTGTQTLTGKTITGTFTGNLTGTASWASNAVTALNGGVTSVSGTANQVIVSGNTGAVTFSLPQSIHTTATPTFTSVSATTFTGALTGTATTASYANALNPANSYTVTGITGNLTGTSSWATNATNALQLGGTAAASYVTLTGTQTLTGKTITGTFTGNLTGTSSWASNATNALQLGGVVAASYVTLADTQSLTNKTITGTFTGNLTGTATTASYANALNAANSYTIAGLTVNGGITFGYGSDAIFYTGTAFDSSKYLILQNNTNEYGRVGLTINAKTFSSANTASTNDGWAMDPRSAIRFRGWLSGDVDYDTKFVIQHLLANATNAVGDLGIFAKGYSTTLPAFVLAGGGNVGIGTTSPAGKLHIVQNNDVGRYSYFGSNSGLFIKANDNSINNLLVLENTQPAANYGVSINFNLGYGGDQTTAGTSVLGSRIVAAEEQTWTSTASTQDAFLSFYTTLNGTSGEKVRITSDGLVGIGTTVPSGKLDVYNGVGRYLNYGTTGLLKIQRNVATSDGATPVLHLINTQGMESTTGLGTGIQMDLGYGGFTTDTVGTAARGTRISAVNDTLYTSTVSTQNASLVFYTSTAGTLTEKLRIRSDGSLSPITVSSTTAGATLLRTDGTNGTLFSVVDDLSDSLMSVNNSAGLPVLEVFADDRIVAGQYGQNDFVVVNNKVGIGTNNPLAKLHVTSSTSIPSAIFMGGNVGIGTTNPVGKLDVRAGSGGEIIFGSYDANYVVKIQSGDQLNFYNGASAGAAYINYGGGATVLSQNLHVEKATGATTGLVRIKADGNVGIGLTLPTTPLHVVGVISGSSFTGAGTGLTGTAASLTAGTATTASYANALNAANSYTVTGITGNVTGTATTASYANALNAANSYTVTGITGNVTGTATTASYANALNAANRYTVVGITGSLFGTSSWATNAVTALNGNVTHTGEVTGATALTIANDAVTTVKILNANVTNAKLASSTVTVGTTSISLGGAETTIGGLVSVTSNAFAGPLTGNVTGNVTGTATTASYANALNVANNYTVTNLTVNTTAQLKGVKETYVDVSHVGNVVTIDLNAGTVFRLNYNAQISSFTISSLTASKVNSFTLISIPTTGAGGINFTFTGYTLVWAGNSVPYATQTGGKFDVFSFIYDGSRWYGFVGGLNY